MFLSMFLLLILKLEKFVSYNLQYRKTTEFGQVDALLRLISL